jgi:hypothetical protein
MSNLGQNTMQTLKPNIFGKELLISVCMSEIVNTINSITDDDAMICSRYETTPPIKYR